MKFGSPRIVGTIVVALALSAAAAHGQEPGTAAPPDAAYLVAAADVLRERPDPTAKVVGKVQPLDIGLIDRVMEGWVRISIGRGQEKPPLVGWLHAGKSTENLLSSRYLDAVIRNVKMANEQWPLATKLDILRQRPRVGFSKELVELALGEPALKNQTETTAGTVEGWAYSDYIVTFGPTGRVKRVSRTQTR